MKSAIGNRAEANSAFHANSASTSPYELGRVAMLREMPLEEFGATCQGRGLWRKELQDRTRQSARQVLGNRIYDKLRAALLRERRH